MKKELWMENVSDIALEASNIIQERLKSFGIELNSEQEDEIYVPLVNIIEKYSNGNYRHEH
jgi:hypothetical protein